MLNLEPIVLFGFSGSENENETNLDFYKNINKIRNSYNYFNQNIKSYEELKSYSRDYKKNWNDTQLNYLNQLEKIYITEHNNKLQKEFVSLSITFGILQNEKIIGFLMLAKVNDELLIVEIFVRKEHRGEGFGKMLFDHIFKLYKNVRFTLHVSTMNLIALQMYLKYDFVIVDTVQNYYIDTGIEPYTDEGVNAYYMIKDLEKVETFS